jgi:hypothetical protein
VDRIFAGPSSPDETPVPAERAPAVDAGANQTITLPASARLNGTVTHAGSPGSSSNMMTGWSKISGPGTVSFADPSAIDTTASFTAGGAYVLRLTASAGALSASDDVTVTVKGRRASRRWWLHRD